MQARILDDDAKFDVLKGKYRYFLVEHNFLPLQVNKVSESLA
jgi:hypothetical protein